MLVATEIQRVAKQNAFIGIEVPVRNPSGTSPTAIEEAVGDNWDYCNPNVLSSLFSKNVKLLDQEVNSTVMRVVMKSPSNQ